MSGPFSTLAINYYNAGLAPIPLGQTDAPSKIPYMKGWQEVARKRMTIDQLTNMVDMLHGRNIGLVMGSVVKDGLQICAVDIDNDDLRHDIEMALPSLVCGKRGAKGVTWFYLCDQAIKTRRIVNQKGTVVDFIADRTQTVIPPSIHPDTKQPYIWLGQPLLEIGVGNLPILHQECLHEIEAIALGKAQYFLGGEMDDKGHVVGLNNMTYAGKGGGGNSHDTRLRVIAHMVGLGWTDEAIVSRINRSMRSAYERGGQTWDNPDWVDHDTRGMIEDARKKGYGAKATPGGKSKVPIERMYAEWINSQMDHPVFFGSEVFYYADGYYHKADSDGMASKVVKMFPTATAGISRASVATFCLLNYKPDFGRVSSDRLCLLNGTLNTTTGEVSAWRPEDELLFKLNVEWRPEATCPKYEAFIRWIFGGDQKSIDVFEEFAGLSFVDDMSFQKMLFLIGGGSNGKSTLVSMITGVHSSDVLSSVPITALNDERMVTSLVGKLLNVSSEQSRMGMLSDETLKKITGGDPIAVRKLFEEVDNNVRMKVRFLCLTNEMPDTSDSSYAMKRRLMILNCPNTVKEEEKDPDLVNKILLEKDGIVKRWIDALNRLRQRGRFDPPEWSSQRVDQMMIESDPLKAWLEENYDPVLNIENDPAVLFGEFIEWAKQANYQRVYTKYHEFVRKLSESGITVKNVQTPSGEKTVIVGGFKAKKKHHFTTAF